MPNVRLVLLDAENFDDQFDLFDPEDEVEDEGPVVEMSQEDVNEFERVMRDWDKWQSFLRRKYREHR